MVWEKRLIGTGTVLGLCLAAAGGVSLGADWPMYRHDAARSGATAEQLAERLHLQWFRALPPRRSAFAYDRRMEHDDGYQPIVAGKTLFVGLEVNNSLLALDVDTGAVRWTFYADGPIRFAPAAAAGRVYFAGEDGRLYCVDAATGHLRWKFGGAPSRRKIINHERLTSNWPAAGGPVVADGRVFFGCGVWPVDGTFVHAVDARTGRGIWTRESEVSWGHLTVVGDWVVQPSGKTPTVFEAATGRRAPVRGAYDVKNLPTPLTAAWGQTHLFNGNKAYALVAGQPTYKTYANAEHQVAIWTPVIDGDRIYGVNDGILKFYRMPTAEELKGMRRKELAAFGGQWWIHSRPAYAWSQVGEPLPLPKGTELPKDWYPRRMEIKAGSRLYAGGPGAVVAIDGVGENRKPRVSWVGKVEGRVTGALAADGKLFVTTRQGFLYCFGPKKVEPTTHKLATPRFTSPDKVVDQVGAVAKAVLAATGQREGYCVVWGLKDGRLAEELRRQSRLRIIAVDPDEKKVDALRRKFDAAGLFDRRLVLMTGDPLTFELPPYMANLIVSEDVESAMRAGRTFVERVFDALRPYGGTACLVATDDMHARLAGWVKAARLPKAAPTRAGGLTLLTRRGALEGAADWTHERVDPANSLCCPDTAFRPPVGLLWYGGPAAEWKRTYGAFIPPALEVVEGRYIMQGHGLLSAIDVYTGRLIWERQVPKVQYYGSYGSPDKPYPENPAKTWVGDHEGQLGGEIEIARLSGNALNVISMPDGIYVTAAEQCWVLDPATGKTGKVLAMPLKDPGAKPALCWGGLRVVGDLLVATAFDPAHIKAAYRAWVVGNEKNKQRMPMRWLIVLDRKTGALLWKRRAQNGFLNWGMAVGGGKVFCLDLVIPEVMAAYRHSKHRTEYSEPVLYALDLKSGREVWKHPVEAYAPNPAYSAEKDVLVLPARSGIYWHSGGWVQPQPPKAQRRGREPAPGLMVAYRGKDGRRLWRVSEANYGEPLILHHGTIVTRSGQTFDLLTGRGAERPDPLTGRMRPWRVSAGACNFLIGSERVTTHRTCYYDMKRQVVFGLRGMRSGCTPSIVPANGVLSLFNYSHNYPSDELRSAMVLVPRPQNANWIRFGGRRGPPAAEQILAAKTAVRRLGLNLGAPADLMGPGGTPWLRQGLRASPRTDSRGRPVPVPASLAEITPETLKVFRHHPASVRPVPGEGWAPVAASGFQGVRQIAVRLRADGAKAPEPARYTVRLHFAEPDEIEPGRRVFSVSLQGRKVLDGLDVTAAAGGRLRPVVRAFRNVEVRDVLKLDLTPAKGALPPVLCGIELIRQPQ